MEVRQPTVEECGDAPPDDRFTGQRWVGLLPIVEDIAAGEPLESVDTGDLMGATTERFCRYKCKFGASLVPYSGVESGGVGMAAAKKASQLVSR